MSDIKELLKVFLGAANGGIQERIGGNFRMK